MKKILVIDVGGSNVKMMISQEEKRRKFPSGLRLGPQEAVAQIKEATRDWDEERIAESVLAQPRRLYGDRVPQPVHVLVSDWQDDPYAYGSYAYMTVGGATRDHDDLATPMGGVLHLAGE